MKIVNIRDFAEDKHKTVDDTPYGGGSGMVMRADVVANSLDNNLESKEKIYYLSPQKIQLNQQGILLIMNNISIIPIKNLPEFEPKHDLADEIVKSFSSNNFVLEDKDIIVITQKIVSKVASCFINMIWKKI